MLWWNLKTKEERTWFSKEWDLIKGINSRKRPHWSMLQLYFTWWTHGNYGNLKDEMLRDRPIVDIRNSVLAQRLQMNC